MRRTVLYLTACAVAALMPLLPVESVRHGGAPSSATFPGWPTSFDGKALTALPLSEREGRFNSNFPGRISRFTDGRREIIIRWTTSATRKLHPATDCFEGIGYRTSPLPLYVDSAGSRWSSFIAARGRERLRVYERIYTDGGESWTDVSAWYWSASGGKSAGPWWAVTIAEKEAD